MMITTGTEKQIEWAQSIVAGFIEKAQAGYEKIAARRQPKRNAEWMEASMEATRNAIDALNGMTDASAIINSREDVNWMLKACGWERPERMKVAFALGEANGIEAYIGYKSQVSA